MTICYIYASRSRTERFFEGLENIDKMSYRDDYFVVAKLDEDDPLMNTQQVRDRLVNEFPQVFVKWGTSKSKIHAINRDIEAIPPFDILINFSDDMHFTQLGFDDMIRRDLFATFPDGDGFIHYPDQYAQDRVSTMSIMGKKYYDRFGYVYNDAYYSLFCDDEETQKAKLTGRYRYFPTQIFEHRHYVTGHMPKDQLYLRNDTYEADKKVFEERQARDFDLKTGPLLSILIPTMPTRTNMLARLMGILSPQLTSQVEVLTDDRLGITIGQKRNEMLAKASGLYVAFVDDDDRVSTEYIKLILSGLGTQPDCCNLNGIITFSGQNPKLFKHSIEYNAMYEKDGVYYRPTMHLNCVRTSIARSCAYPDKKFGEDADYAFKLMETGLLKREHKIEAVLYFYDFVENKTN